MSGEWGHLSIEANNHLHAVCRTQGRQREPSVIRHPVPHFLPNSGGIACWVAELNFISSSGDRNHNQSVLQSHLVPRRHDWSQIIWYIYKKYDRYWQIYVCNENCYEVTQRNIIKVGQKYCDSKYWQRRKVKIQRWIIEMSLIISTGCLLLTWLNDNNIIFNVYLQIIWEKVFF